MTETEIIKILARSIEFREYPFQIPNAFIYGWESDYWVLSARGVTKEFEIKCSRADYLIDCKKGKHSSQSGANFFYYVCPEGLISKAEVNAGYGLIYVSEEGQIRLEKRPRRLNNNVFNDWKMLANKMYWRWYGLWREKYIDKEITHSEYLAAFSIELELETSPNASEGDEK